MLDAFTAILRAFPNGSLSNRAPYTSEGGGENCNNVITLEGNYFVTVRPAAECSTT